MGDMMAIVLIFVAVFLFLAYQKTKTGVYAGEITLNPGTYRIGEDLDPGKGDLTAVSGKGEVCIRERKSNKWDQNFKLHADNSGAPSRYRNLTLRTGDTLEINGSLQLTVTPSTAIVDGETPELTMGIYQLGVDLPPAKYDLTATAGSGSVQYFEPDAKERSFFQSMSCDDDDNASVYENLLCTMGGRLVVDGTLTLELTRSRKQHGKVQKILDFLNQSP